MSDRLRADAALVGVGSWAYSKTIIDSRGEPSGGIVCAILGGPIYDTDTGEIRDATQYRVRDPDDLDRFRVKLFGVADVDPADATMAHPREVGRLARRLAYEIGRSKNRTSTVAKELSHAEIMAWTDIHALIAAVGLG